MKKILIFALMAMVFVSCSKRSKVRLYDVNNFTTTIDGKPVSLYTLDNGGLMMQVTNYGGRIVSLWAPDRKNRYENIVVGYDNINDYAGNENSRFVGAALGRYANVLSNGKVTIDGTDYELTKNEDGNTFNGGNLGLDRVVWDVNSLNDTTIEFHTVLADGTDGFPGNLNVTMTYTLTSTDELVVTYRATTDATTVCNLTNALMFNLKGAEKGSVLDHELMINAKFYTTITDAKVPTGNMRPVNRTPMDFTVAKTIGKDINSDHPQMQFASRYDFNWLLSKPFGKIGHAATVYEPVSGRRMEILTNQPGMQFCCEKLPEQAVSFVLEPQNFPDAPNQERFPSAGLKPGDEYNHTSIYRFSVVK